VLAARDRASRPTVIRLTSYHRYTHRPSIAHARNVNVGTGIGERQSGEPRDPRGVLAHPPAVSLRKDEGLSGDTATPVDCER
jgi:hypothetical protein